VVFDCEFCDQSIKTFFLRKAFGIALTTSFGCSFVINSATLLANAEVAV
jgi:hypothetical protein